MAGTDQVLTAPHTDDEATAPDIVEALAQRGWSVAPRFLSAEETAALRTECLSAFAAGAFHAAGVGSGSARAVSEIRGDHVLWLDEANASPALQAVLTRLESLRQEVNRTLYLGLFDLELHFAAYPVGAGYQRHLDRFRDDGRRALTVILYLNPADWSDADGGQLRFWAQDGVPPVDILPTGGTLVSFLAERFWHQVLPARRQRLSLTGWFRRR
jgi:SM-20-related protein